MALSLVTGQVAPLFQGSKSQSQAGSAHPLPSGWVMGSQVSTIITTTPVRPLPGHTAEAPRGVPAPAFAVAARTRCSPAPVVPPIRPLPFSIARPALPPPSIKQSRTAAIPTAVRPHGQASSPILRPTFTNVLMLKICLQCCLLSSLPSKSCPSPKSSSSPGQATPALSFCLELLGQIIRLPTMAQCLEWSFSHLTCDCYSKPGPD